MSSIRKGFTLIELLIVIAIILILIAIALPNFLEAQIRARATKSAGEIRTYVTALETYYVDWAMYPRDHDSAWPYVELTTQNGFQMLTTPLTYLTELPADPFGTNTTGDEVVPGVPRNRSFHYEGGSGSDSNACGGRISPYLNRAPSPPTPALAKKCVQAYLVIGIGPDQDDSSGGNDDFPIHASQPPTGPPMIGFDSYSATNGTKSRGDIYGFAGQFQQGYFYLDGQIVGYPR